MPTIKDVAREAGVSPATVSYVLNQSVPVSAPTRERVLAAVEQLGYRPSRLARNLQGQRTSTLALIADQFDSFDLDLAPLLYGCVAAANAAGYALLVTSTQVGQSLEMVLDQTLDGGLADGGIMLAPYAPALVHSMPLVWAFAPPRGVSAPTVLCDGSAGALRAYAALVHAGCQAIGLVLPPDGSHAGARWYLGYRRALRQAGHSFDPALVVAPAAECVEAGEAAGEALLAAGCDGAIVAGSQVALGVAHVLHALPLIAGFDTDLIAGADISALVWPVQAWSHLLVEQVIRLINHQAVTQRVYLEPSLVVRA